MMSLSATLDRDGETVHDGPLTGILDSGIGSHYGMTINAIDGGGPELALSVGAPPQTARYEGYETAFVGVGGLNRTI